MGRTGQMPEGWYLGLDLGGTKIAVGLVSSKGEVMEREERPTLEARESGDPLAFVFGMARRLLTLRSERSLRAVGVALPGPVDLQPLRLLSAPTLPELEGVALSRSVEAEFGCPVGGDNDANAAALAESRYGAGAGSASVVYLTVSTGIGGGIVLDGQLLRGRSGTSAEVGHQVIVPRDGPSCDCGGAGCLEALASGRAIARQARLRLEQAGRFDLRGIPASGIDAAAVAEAARQGDELARGVWEEAAVHLGLGIANVINLLDPDVVVLGGGVAVGAADLLLDGVRRVVDERCMPNLRRQTPIVTARLGRDAGVLGAACLAMDITR